MGWPVSPYPSPVVQRKLCRYFPTRSMSRLTAGGGTGTKRTGAQNHAAQLSPPTHRRTKKRSGRMTQGVAGRAPKRLLPGVAAVQRRPHRPPLVRSDSQEEWAACRQARRHPPHAARETGDGERADARGGGGWRNGCVGRRSRRRRDEVRGGSARVVATPGRGGRAADSCVGEARSSCSRSPRAARQPPGDVGSHGAHPKTPRLGRQWRGRTQKQSTKPPARTAARGCTETRPRPPTTATAVRPGSGPAADPTTTRAARDGSGTTAAARGGDLCPPPQPVAG